MFTENFLLLKHLDLFMMSEQLQSLGRKGGENTISPSYPVPLQHCKSDVRTPSDECGTLPGDPLLPCDLSSKS